MYTKKNTISLLIIIGIGILVGIVTLLIYNSSTRFRSDLSYCPIEENLQWEYEINVLDTFFIYKDIVYYAFDGIIPNPYGVTVNTPPGTYTLSYFLKKEASRDSFPLNKFPSVRDLYRIHLVQDDLAIYSNEQVVGIYLFSSVLDNGKSSSVREVEHIKGSKNTFMHKDGRRV